MPNTTNFNWATPADTDLVKDGASAMRTLGNSIDASFVDLKGGTTGQFLSKASNTDLDYAWANPTAGANWTLLNSGGTALTGAATITVSGISGADKIMVLVQSGSSASASSFIQFRINTSSSGIYSSIQNVYNFPAAYTNSNYYGQDIFNGTEIELGRMSSSAGTSVDAAITLSGCNSAGVKQFIMSGGGRSTGGADDGHVLYVGQGFINTSSTISSISVISNSGNFDAGTVFVYTSA